jgi:Lysophospholipase catalytic domain
VPPIAHALRVKWKIRTCLSLTDLYGLALGCALLKPNHRENTFTVGHSDSQSKLESPGTSYPFPVCTAVTPTGGEEQDAEWIEFTPYEVVLFSMHLDGEGVGVGV